MQAGIPLSNKKDQNADNCSKSDRSEFTLLCVDRSQTQKKAYYIIPYYAHTILENTDVFKDEQRLIIVAFEHGQKRIRNQLQKDMLFFFFFLKCWEFSVFLLCIWFQRCSHQNVSNCILKKVQITVRNLCLNKVDSQVAMLGFKSIIFWI